MRNIKRKKECFACQQEYDAYSKGYNDALKLFQEEIALARMNRPVVIKIDGNDRLYMPIENKIKG